MIEKTQPARDDALLLIGPACPYCAAMLESLSKLVKTGQLATLEIINIQQRPELARTLGVRSVPWLKLGEFVFEGQLKEKEITAWLQQTDTEQAQTDYLAYLLKSGKLHQAIQVVKGNHDSVRQLITLTADQHTDMKVRIGISAVLEDLQGQDLLKTYIPEFAGLARNDHPSIRADAAHFLSLYLCAESAGYLRRLAEDANEEVREIAREALAEYDDVTTNPN